MGDIINKDDEKDTKKSGFFNSKVLLGIAAATGIGVGAATSYFAAQKIYDGLFKRYERPDYSVKPGIYNYALVKDRLPREEISFYSDKVRLQGYYYKVDNPNGLVVISHGMHAGADDYLPMTMFFTKQNYSVFSYDYKGTYSSEGKSTVGMCESIIDLDHALDFIKSDSRFAGLKIFLVGHSWGGFATASVLSLHSGISAAACIAPFNSGYTLFVEKGKEYTQAIDPFLDPTMKIIKSLPDGFLNMYQKELFKDYIQYTGVKGINHSGIPVLVAHGDNDKIISYTGQSIISHRAEITNPNVQYYIGKGLQSGHDSIWHSEESAVYISQVEQDLKRLKKQKGDDLTHEELAAYNNTVNHELYSQINSELFNQIIEMFNKAN